MNGAYSTVWALNLTHKHDYTHMLIFKMLHGLCRGFREQPMSR